MHAPFPPPAPQTVRLVRDPLVTITCVLVILAVAGYAFETVRQHVATAAAVATRGSQAGKIEQDAHTNAQAAHVTFTNLNGFDVETCVRGVVTPKRGAGRVVSGPVCTGVMKPRTTVVLEASYPVVSPRLATS
jgi:hypothetical protein